MSISLTPNDPRVRIFALDTWHDVTLQVRQADGGLISIEQGNEDEALGDEINPGMCQLTFDNNDGWFTPDNPHSPFYPDLGINTPLCVLLDEIKDLYSRTASNTWGNTATGETYATKSVGGVISATDFSTNGSVGVHSVPAVSSYRMSYLGSSSRAPLAYNVIQKIRYTPTFSNVTGGNIEPANLQCRLLSDTQYYMLRAEVTTAEAITLSIYRDTSTLIAGPVTVSGITHTIGQPIWFALGALDDTLYVTAWQGDTIADEPTDWLLSVVDTTYGYGWYGVRSGVSSGNSNTKPVTFNYDYYSVYTSEFNGEIPDLPQEFSDDGIDMVVPITAGGVLRRYAETKTKLKSSMRRFYEVKEPAAGVTADYYWPLDEGELSTEGAASIGPLTAPFAFNFTLSTDTASKKHFGQGTLAAWLPNGVDTLPGAAGNEYLQVFPQPPTADAVSDFWCVQWVRSGGRDTSDQFGITGYLDSGVTISGVGADAFTVACDSFEETIRIAPGLLAAVTVVDATTLASNIFDGAAHIFRFRANVTAGTDVNWSLHVDSVSVASGTVLAHPFMQSIGALYMTPAGGGPTFIIPPTKPTTWGHVALYVTDDENDQDIAYDHFIGSAGETAQIRARRFCSEEGVPSFTTGTGGMTMGPQFEDTLFAQFEEIVRTDGGIFREIISGRGIAYISLEDLRATEVTLTLDVSDETLATGGFHPVRNSQRLRNKITAKKRAGSQYTYEKTTGRLGTADPKDGGSGVYDGGETNVNPETDQQLISIAQREVTEGTIDRARFPVISVDLQSDTMRTDLALRRQVLDTYISTRMILTGMSRWHIYDDADLLVIGHKRMLSPYIHTVTWNTIPFDSLDTFHVETAGSILGTDSSTIVSAIDSDDTAISVTTVGESLWTTSAGSMPILAKINGEDVSITNVTTLAPSFRSVGTASHGDNATTTPGLPAGHTAGDNLVLFTVIRNTAATANVPTGYTQLATFGHIKICAKIDSGAESVPNCTYSGGAVGDTTSSFIIALPNCPLLHSDGGSASNASAQDVIYPALTVTKSNTIELWWFWKQDDFTSVAVPLGLTEIIEASTTTGNDQSAYAAYRLVPRANDSVAGSFVVTGGASAISKAIALSFSNPQSMTIARSQNGVVKSHAASSSIKIAYPKLLG